MADDVITRAGPVPAPLDYLVPVGTEIIPISVSASFDGSNAAGAFIPVLEVIAPTGVVTAYCARRVPIAAGASVLVSWFPGVAEADNQSSSSPAAGLSSITSPNGTLTVNNPTGPNVNIDMPVTGVAAGTYGDASHSAAITVDAEGRLTAASQVGIAGGSGTIGFEIGYDQITAPVNIASTTEGTPTTIIAGSSYTFDGAAVLATFWCPYLQIGTSGTQTVDVHLWEGGTEIGRIAHISFGSNVAQEAISVCGFYRFTPTAGAHTYSIKAHCNNVTGPPAVGAGAGGVGAYLPAFLRLTKV